MNVLANRNETRSEDEGISELLVEDEIEFWQAASAASLDEVWDNEEDDVHAELLEA